MASPFASRHLLLVLLLASVAASPAAATKRRAFLTSVSGTGDLSTWPGASGSTPLERGDAICRSRAAAGGLPNASTYHAWLSTSSLDAYCHVQGLDGTLADLCNGAPLPGGGPWYLVDGVTPFT